MVLLDEKMLAEITSFRNFQTQSRKLYHNLRYDNMKDAENELLFVFLDRKPIRTMSNCEFHRKWNEPKGKSYISYQITYARMDIERNKYQQVKRQIPKDDIEISSEIPSSTDAERAENTKHQSQLVLANLKLLFPRSWKKRRYIEKVLNGEAADDEVTLRSIKSYCNDHRKEFDRVLGKDLSNQDKKILSFIETFLSVEDNGSTLFEIQGKQAEIISQHKALFEDLIGTCGSENSHYITHQVALLNHWEKIEYQTEKNYLVEYLRIKQEELKNKLNK